MLTLIDEEHFSFLPDKACHVLLTSLICIYVGEIHCVPCTYRTSPPCARGVPYVLYINGSKKRPECLML